jgi:hypothetical protein
LIKDKITKIENVGVKLHTLLIIKPTRCTNFSKFIFGRKLYMFQTVPLSIIRSFSLYTQQWYMSYRFADSLQAGSGWNQFHPDPESFDFLQRQRFFFVKCVSCGGGCGYYCLV